MVVLYLKSRTEKGRLNLWVFPSEFSRWILALRNEPGLRLSSGCLGAVGGCEMLGVSLAVFMCSLAKAEVSGTPQTALPRDISAVLCLGMSVGIIAIIAGIMSCRLSSNIYCSSIFMFRITRLEYPNSFV